MLSVSAPDMSEISPDTIKHSSHTHTYTHTHTHTLGMLWIPMWGFWGRFDHLIRSNTGASLLPSLSTSCLLFLCLYTGMFKTTCCSGEALRMVWTSPLGSKKQRQLWSCHQVETYLWHAHLLLLQKWAIDCINYGRAFFFPIWKVKPTWIRCILHWFRKKRSHCMEAYEEITLLLTWFNSSLYSFLLGLWSHSLVSGLPQHSMMFIL